MEKKSSITIGLLLNFLKGKWNQTMAQGIKSAASVFGINVVQFCTGGLKHGQYGSYNVISELVNPEQLDGLIISGSVMSSYLTTQDCVNFCLKFKIPFLTINRSIPGHTCIFYDFYTVTSVAVKHLIADHKYTKIALMLNHFAANYPVCLQAIKDVHESFGLTYDETLNVKIISENDADFLQKAVNLVNNNVQAVVSIDRSAIRSIGLLTKAGYHIPEDLAFIGLNDLPHSNMTTPPLTTINRSLTGLGNAAVSNLLKLINGEKVDDEIFLTPALIKRRSCGCHGQFSLAKPIDYNEKKEKISTSFKGFSHNKDNLIAGMTKILGDMPESDQSLDRLLAAYIAEMQNPGIESFIPSLEEILKKQEMINAEIYIWQNILTLLIDWSIPFLLKNKNLLAMQLVWQQARLLISDRHQLQQSVKVIQTRLNYNKQRIMANLSTIYKTKDLYSLVAVEMQKNEFDTVYIVLYENPGDYKYPDPPPEWSRLVMACQNKEMMDIEKDGIRFPTKNFLPDEFWLEIKTAEENKFIIVEGLISPPNQLGYILFVVTGQVTDATFWLRNIIATALQGSAFYKEIQRQTAEIKELNNKLNIENLKMSAELKIVKQLQKMILPAEHELLAIKNCKVTAYFQPSSEIGGDYYDVIANNNTTYFGIGDVTGHGLESGIIMIMTQTVIRTMVKSGETDLLKIYKALNRILFTNIKNIETNRKVTLLIAELKNRKIRFIGYHDEPFIVEKQGQIQVINTVESGTLLGVIPEIKKEIKPVQYKVKKGDNIVLYTDGITEARGENSNIYSEGRLQRIISHNWGKNTEIIKKSVIRDLNFFTGREKRDDDTSLLIIKVL